MPDLILDAETLGQNVLSAPILNFSFFLFDVGRFTAGVPYLYDEVLNGTFRLKLSVEDQVRNGYRIEQSTLEFWDSVGEEAKKQLIPRPNDLTYAEFCDRMVEWLGDRRVNYWWSRSNTFDPILLWRIFKDSGRSADLDQRLKYWKVRDVRTYIDAKTDFSLAKNAFTPMPEAEWNQRFKAHDSRHDITADVLRLQKLVRIDAGLE